MCCFIRSRWAARFGDCAIWGLVVLFGKQSAPAHAGGGAYASASTGGQPSDYMQRARNDAARQKTSSSDGDAGSTLTAVACLGGGVVCLAITVFLCFALYTSFTGGDAEVRRSAGPSNRMEGIQDRHQVKVSDSRFSSCGARPSFTIPNNPQARSADGPMPTQGRRSFDDPIRNAGMQR